MGEPFSFTVLVSAVCGLVMVVGGIALLWRGAISLDTVSNTEALSVEWKKQFRLTTHAPALALFIIGLGFIVVPLWMAKPKALPIVEITGEKDEGISQPIRLIIETEPWISGKPHEQMIEEELDLSNIILVIKATAALHNEQEQRRIPLGRLLGGDLDLSKIELQRVVGEISATANEELIDSLPIIASPLHKAGAFGK
ncbi:MAG: hypothetical protein JSU77_05570 [Fidelibacterota bacterium]|nr:MAG: hypothetical protein JSU77_05570 [Candidatus Neomarinimicrobiota bacterium]